MVSYESIRIYIKSGLTTEYIDEFRAAGVTMSAAAAVAYPPVQWESQRASWNFVIPAVEK